MTLAPDNASSVRDALVRPPLAHGERPLIEALDAAVTEFANLPVTLGQGDVQTVRRIVVFTDGPDQCGDDLSRVTTSLAASAIQLEFHIIGIDLAPADQQLLTDVAQSLPGVGSEPAKVTPVGSSEELEDALITFSGEGSNLFPDETTPTPDGSTVTTPTVTTPTTTPSSTTPAPRQGLRTTPDRSETRTERRPSRARNRRSER